MISFQGILLTRNVVINNTAPEEDEWILANNAWDDSGVWEDDDMWKD